MRRGRYEKAWAAVRSIAPFDARCTKATLLFYYGDFPPRMALPLKAPAEAAKLRRRHAGYLRAQVLLDLAAMQAGEEREEEEEEAAAADRSDTGSVATATATATATTLDALPIELLTLIFSGLIELTRKSLYRAGMHYALVSWRVHAVVTACVHRLLRARLSALYLQSPCAVDFVAPWPPRRRRCCYYYAHDRVWRGYRCIETVGELVQASRPLACIGGELDLRALRCAPTTGRHGMDALPRSWEPAPETKQKDKGRCTTIADAVPQTQFSSDQTVVWNGPCMHLDLPVLELAVGGLYCCGFTLVQQRKGYFTAGDLVRHVLALYASPFSQTEYRNMIAAARHATDTCRLAVAAATAVHAARDARLAALSAVSLKTRLERQTDVIEKKYESRRRRQRKGPVLSSGEAVATPTFPTLSSAPPSGHRKAAKRRLPSRASFLPPGALLSSFKVRAKGWPFAVVLRIECSPAVGDDKTGDGTAPAPALLFRQSDPGRHARYRTSSPCSVCAPASPHCAWPSSGEYVGDRAHRCGSIICSMAWMDAFARALKAQWEFRRRAGQPR